MPTAMPISAAAPPDGSFRLVSTHVAASVTAITPARTAGTRSAACSSAEDPARTVPEASMNPTRATTSTAPQASSRRVIRVPATRWARTSENSRAVVSSGCTTDSAPMCSA